jgi:hypothetical protein
MFVNTVRGKRLEKFLFCLELELGGMIIGWLGVAGDVLATLLFVAIVVGVSQGFVSDTDLSHMGMGGYGDPKDENYYDTVRSGKNWNVGRSMGSFCGEF